MSNMWGAQPTLLARRDGNGRDHRNLAYSLICTTRRLKRSRSGSALLALLVGLTLTLVCQGHIEDNHISGPHITFLGEPGHNHNPGTQEESASSNDKEDYADPDTIDMAAMYMPGMSSIAGMTMTMYAAWQTITPLVPPPASDSSSLGGNIANALANSPLESVTLATLSFTLLLWLLRHNANLRSLEIAGLTLRTSQTSTWPEPPPPRLPTLLAFPKRPTGRTTNFIASMLTLIC